MANPLQNDDLAFQLRRSVSNAYAFVRGREATSSFLATTFEDLVAAQVDRLSGKGANPNRPNEIDRVKKVEADIVAAAAQIKQIPPGAFSTANNETGVNTPVLRPIARFGLCDTSHHMAPKSPDMTTITVRIPVSMLNEIDKVVTREKKRGMGSPYTRSDAVRDLVRDAIQSRPVNGKELAG
jgi:hypothetical protein